MEVNLCCIIMKINLKNLNFILFLFSFVFALNGISKELQEGHLYYTSLGPPQLAMEKPIIETLEKQKEKISASSKTKFRDNNTFLEKSPLSKIGGSSSDKKKSKNKSKIKSTSLKQKRDSRKAKKRRKIDFIDKNRDGYDDRHKAEDL